MDFCVVSPSVFPSQSVRPVSHVQSRAHGTSYFPLTCFVCHHTPHSTRQQCITLFRSLLINSGKLGRSVWASVCLVWNHGSSLRRRETAYNEKKGPQLTSPHSTHPSVQQEAVWPKFTLPHLPRHLFSLLGKHLEKCMRERGGKKEYICLNTSHLVRRKAKPGHLQTYTAL